MLYAYRAGQSRITNKVWLKLESAERLAGIERGEPEGRALASGVPGESISPPSRLAEIQAQLVALQQEVSGLAAFSYQDLQARLQSAGAWPPSPADAQLSPGQLWHKYAPAK